jgi:hypothetical protein
MVPHDQAHQRLTRWMRPTDPIYLSWVEHYTESGVEWEAATANDLNMIYAHERDGSCCQEITNRNRPTYTRDQYGRILRGG